MRADIEYLKISAKEAAEENGHTLPPIEFRTISNRGVANFNSKIVAYAHHWSFSGNRIKLDSQSAPGSKPTTKTDLSFYARRHVGALDTRWRTIATWLY